MADKRPKMSALRALPEQEVPSQVHTLHRELWTMRIKATDGSLQQPHQIRVIKRQIARLSTLLTERQREAASRKQSP